MEQYNSIQQLLKKEDGHKDRKPIYPPTVIQAVFDAKTGASLEAVLAQFNSVYVQYQGTPEATRNIIPVQMRRAGLTITYMNMDSETITERASSAVQKDNDHWGLDVNWSRVDELSLSGDIAVSAQGTWIINGEDTKIPARGSKGDTGLTPWLKTIGNKLHFSYDNTTWEECSDYIASYFRFHATSSDGQAVSLGKLQISRDNKTWTDISPEFTNNLRISGYVATTSALPANQVVGTIYGVGPTYAADDTAQTNPIYRLHVWNGTSWVDNGQFTSIAAGVVQETGDSETEVMSQKAVSEKLSELGSKFIDYSVKDEELNTQNINGYTVFDTGANDGKAVNGTYLIENKGYSIIKAQLGFDSNYYAAIAFYSSETQDASSYIKSASIEGKSGVNTYTAFVPENCKLIAISNRPSNLSNPFIEAFISPSTEIAGMGAYVGAYLFGDFYVDITTGDVVSKTNVDVYFGKNVQFHRFNAGVTLFNITKTSGGNSVLFDPIKKEFFYGYYKDGIIVGVTSGRYFYPNGTCVVEYSNGKIDKITRLLTEEVLSIKDRVDKIDIVPEYVNNAAHNTWKRLIEWSGSDDVALIAQITDIHSGGNKKYLHVGYLNKLNDLFSFDVLANMGDIGIDYSSSETQGEMMSLIDKFKSRMSATSPWVFCKGNHEGKLNNSNIILGNIFNRDVKNRKPECVEFGDSSKNYGYYDVEAHKLRVYFLNTTDTNNITNGYALSTEQVQWVADTLAEVKEDWNVVILTHLCIESCGRTTAETGTMRYGIYDNLCLVMEGFNEKNSGWRMVKWDFTASKAGKIVCNLCGDSHFNNSDVVNGLNYIVRQGYGQGSSEYLPIGATKDEFDSEENCLFDILAIKNDGNAKIFRIGVGDVNRDFSFTY